jgi:tRNA pseudouridine55 synthase
MDFLQGETLLVDKPLGWTSFDVVNKLRWNIKQALRIKNIKVGHAGTLDPLATGLLVICTGKHTKRIEEYIEGNKRYTGTILLGKTTPSYDLETAFHQEFPTNHLQVSDIALQVQSFLGETLQIPPLFSAKQIDGKRAYDLARAGSDLVLDAKPISIGHFEIDASRFPEINFDIECSKGTYIRSIAHDLGKKLGCGGTLTALRRTASGRFSLEDAKSVEKWIAIIRGDEA